MGCGNSLPTKPSQGQVEETREAQKEPAAEEEDERKINYGGVYVGIPADPNAMMPVEIGSVVRVTS